MIPTRITVGKRPKRRQLPPVAAFLSGPPTITVAASDASAFSKSHAHLEATGTDDQDTIQDAINSLPSSGGRVLLTEGTFNINVPVGGEAIQVFGGTQLAGLGAGHSASGTVLNQTAGGAGDILHLYGANRLSNIAATSSTLGTRAVVIDDFNTSIHIDHCYLETNGGACIYGEDGNDFLRVTNCNLVVTTSFNGDATIHLNSPTASIDMVWIENCSIFGGQYGILLDGTPGSTTLTRIYLVNNRIDQTGYDGIVVNRPGFGVIVAGNVIEDSGNDGAGTNAAGIRVEDAQTAVVSGVIIANNNVKDMPEASGIYLSNADRVVVEGNTLQFVDYHGIHVEDCSDLLIEGNLITDPGQDVDNTYDGIFVEGDSDNSLITGNKIIGDSSAPQPRYGINISAATCDNNAYVGNKTGPSTDYGTGTYNDSGTGTVITYPGAASPQGDNIEGGASSGVSSSASNFSNFSQTGTLSTGTGTFKIPFTVDAEIISVQLGVGTSPTGAALIVDVHKNGTTIFTTQANRPTVPAGDADGIGAEATPDVTSVSEGEYLTVDIDQVGSSVAGTDLVVTVEWRPT